MNIQKKYTHIIKFKILATVYYLFISTFKSSMFVILRDVL